MGALCSLEKNNNYCLMGLGNIQRVSEVSKVTQ
jgi:hypothetical protein